MECKTTTDRLTLCECLLDTTAEIAFDAEPVLPDYCQDIGKVLRCSAVPVLNGIPAGGKLEIMSWTQENFAAQSARERENGPLPYFLTSTFNMGVVPAGKTVEIEFPCTNKGRRALHFFKADTDLPQLEATALPEIGAQGKGSVRFTLDTSALSKGEQVLMITLTTNSPLRPMVNLFVAGEIR